MERDVEFYVKSGFNFAKGMLEKLFDKTSISISINEEEFQEGANALKRIEKDFSEKNLRAYMREDDLKIRLNKKVLEKEYESFSLPLKEFYYTWSAYITSYFYPYSFFLEFTNYGKNLREKIRSSYLKGKMEEDVKREVESIRRWFSGIGFWAETKIEENLPSASIFSEIIRVVKEGEKVLEYLEDSDGFKFCNILERKAKESFIEEYKKKAIVAEAIKYADKMEENFPFGLEKLMIKIKKGEMGVEEIFSPGIKLFIVEPQVDEIYKNYLELTKNILTRNWSIFKRDMEKVCSNLEKMGEDELSERGLEIIFLIEKEFSEAMGLESGKMYIEDLLKNQESKPIYLGLREWLLDVESFCRKFGEWRIKEL